MKTKKIALTALFITLSMILSYFENMLPPLVSIPGIKLGFANIVIIYVLYKFSAKQALKVSLIRVLLMGLLFGSFMSTVFSFVGALTSISGMVLLKKTGKFSHIGISVSGGILHNIGQIVTAIFIVETAQIIYYLPALLISGTLAGIITGFIAILLINRTK